MLIKDNGIGLENGKQKNGHGLKNMKMRAARIGAHLDISCKSGEGSQIALRMNKI